MEVHKHRDKTLKNYPEFVPDGMLTEEWAQNNHGQSLKILNERGGMSVPEILANIKKILRADHTETQDKIDELNKLIREFNQ